MTALSVKVDFDNKIYSLDVIKKAAYRFIDKFSVDLQLSGDVVSCTFNFTGKTSPESAELLKENFKKEVLDQDLRESIANETLSLRNLILAHAFSKTSLIKDG